MPSERHKPHQAENDDAQWLTAYADLISAVLAVVVLMLTFAPVNLDELTTAVVEQEPSTKEVAQIIPLVELKKELEALASQHDLTEFVNFNYDHRGLEVSIDSVALFEVGSAILNTEQLTDFQPLLQRICSVSFDRFIDIQGHTDDTGGSELNWRLSSERALSMLQYMEKYELSNAGIRLIAYADTQPLMPIYGLTEDRLDAARKANRRISLLIHRRMKE